MVPYFTGQSKTKARLMMGFDSNGQPSESRLATTETTNENRERLWLKQVRSLSHVIHSSRKALRIRSPENTGLR